MSDFTPYSNIITDTEAKLGFELVTVKNPRGEFAFTPEMVEAVIYKVNSTDRIIKLNNPFSGPPTYQHQRYGVFKGQNGARADWKPVSSFSYPNPEMAIRSITHGTESMLQEIVKFDPEVIPVEPGEYY